MQIITQGTERRQQEGSLIYYFNRKCVSITLSLAPTIQNLAPCCAALRLRHYTPPYLFPPTITIHSFRARTAACRTRRLRSSRGASKPRLTWAR